HRRTVRHQPQSTAAATPAEAAWVDWPVPEQSASAVPDPDTLFFCPFPWFAPSRYTILREFDVTSITGNVIGVTIVPRHFSQGTEILNIVRPPQELFYLGWAHAKPELSPSRNDCFYPAYLPLDSGRRALVLVVCRFDDWVLFPTSDRGNVRV